LTEDNVVGYGSEYPNATNLEAGVGRRWRDERADLTALLDGTTEHPYEPCASHTVATAATGPAVATALAVATAPPTKHTTVPTTGTHTGTGQTLTKTDLPQTQTVA
jgi:hypothetical protein